MIDLRLLLDRLAGLPEGERLPFFSGHIREQLCYVDPLTRDAAIYDCHKALRPIGVRLDTIRQAVADELKEHGLAPEEGTDGAGKADKLSQADILITLAGKATLFHDDHQEPFALVTVDEHGETWPVRSKLFKRWLAREYYGQTGKAPNSEAVAQALSVIEAKACFDGPKHKLELRVAAHDGAIWYDLADPAWRAVKITAEGWQVVDRPPILFRRYKNTAAQVVPAPSGNIEEALSFVNLQTDEERTLFKVLLVVCLVFGIPHPIPVAHGEKGAAKSTFLRVIRRLVDPAVQELLSLPPDKNELALQLAHNYLPAFDNLDGLQGWQSDMLCTAATGGGISKRELYSDEDEVILSFLRCPALNGINMVASRADLLDRALIFGLERIDPMNRREESQFWADFEKARPSIMGGMFAALAGAMRIYPTVKLDRLPRMADFCRWGYAVAEALGVGGQRFLEAYWSNIGRANEEALSSNPVAAAVVAFMAERETWAGTAGQLLEALDDVAAQQKISTRSRSWPQAANTLTRRLKAIRSNLADAGIEYEARHTNKGAVLSLRRVTENIVTTVTSSQTQERRGFPGDDTGDDTSSRKNTVTISSPPEPRNRAAPDGSDGSDDTFGNPPDIGYLADERAAIKAGW